MTIENMKGFVIGRYNGKVWHDKVNCMSDEQVIAIYYKLKRTLKAPCVLSKEEWEKVHTSYVCFDCHTGFVADNPELSECRHCGSSQIATDKGQVYIRKGDDNE